MEEREKRKRNIIIKGLEVRDGRIKEEVNKLWREMGVQAEIEEWKEINKKWREKKDDNDESEKQGGEEGSNAEERSI